METISERKRLLHKRKWIGCCQRNVVRFSTGNAYVSCSDGLEAQFLIIVQFMYVFDHRRIANRELCSWTPGNVHGEISSETV